jgi:hypothetical protein
MPYALCPMPYALCPMPYAARLLFALLIGGAYYLLANHSFADDRAVLLTEDGGVDGCEQFFSPGVDPFCEESESTTDWKVKPRQLTSVACTLFIEE